MSNLALVVIALAALGGPLLNAWIQSIYEKRRVAATVKVAQAAEKVKADTELAQTRAQADAATAQRQAADAVKALILAAETVAQGQSVTDGRLVKLQVTADGTHEIVNHQRTVMLELVASMAERIARENPNDAEAVAHAAAAREEANKAAAVPTQGGRPA